VFVAPDGVAGVPVVLGSLEGNSGLGPPAVAIDDAGRATVAWYDSNSADPRLHVATGNASDGFGAPQVLDAERPPWEAPRVGVDSHGGAAVAWMAGRRGPTPSVMVATRPSADAQFSAPQKLGASDMFELEVTPKGDAAVMWTGARAGYEEAHSDLRGMYYARVSVGETGGGAFMPFYDGEPSHDMEFPTMGSDSAGGLTFLYRPAFGYSPSPNSQLLVTSATASGGFGETHEVACPAGPAASPSRLLTWSPDEIAALLWRYDSSGPRNVRHYSLIRTAPGSPPAPEYCVPPKAPPPASAPPALAVSAPKAVRPAKLKRLPVTVSSRGSGSVSVSGVVKPRGGKRSVRFKRVRWKTEGSQHKRIRLRLPGGAAALHRVTRAGATARVKVVMKGAGGITRTRVARIRVRR
jgi:hypothetical protein